MVLGALLLAAHAAAADGDGVVAPTAAQLRWMQDEIGAIGHFNMGTFQACGIGADAADADAGLALPPASTFAPTNVQPEQWIKALASAGVTRAVLVVSHGCGFNTFPSRTNLTLADGRHFVYNYSVRNSPWKGGQGDIAQEFVEACRAHKIRPGFYHGSVNNAFLNLHSGKIGRPSGIAGQAVITQDEYEQILLLNLRQLWTDYGPLAEVWFDGGIPNGFANKLWALHQELQPDAVAFQGPTVGKSPNLIRWAGTEGGHVKYPFWSADTAKKPLGSPDAGAGSPNGTFFAPGEADTCFQGGRKEDGLAAPYGGCWFYNKGMVPKSLAELVSSYHDSVGKNAFWLIDWTPTQEGILRPDHIERYKELGDWLHECYGVPIAEAAMGGLEQQDGAMSFTVPPGHQVDRVMLQEDLTDGQRVRGFEVMQGGAVLLSGSSIGNKYIGLLNETLPAGATVTLKITEQVGAAKVAKFAGYNCSRAPSASGCSLQQDFAYLLRPHFC